MSKKALSINNLQIALSQNNDKMKAWMQSKLDTFKTFTIEWVEELPVREISTLSIYMVRDTESTEDRNIYKEYVYHEETGWEIIGTLDAGSINLANYYDKTEIDDLLANISIESCTDEEITTMIDELWSEG
jgi:hypothetical protein